MCGLVGVVGNITHTDLKIFNLMLWMDQIRGKHSTGVASGMFTSQYIKGTWGTLKMVGTPDKLVDCKEYPSYVNISKQFIMGHNRHATQGAINTENAHPFGVQDIVLAHNGSLTSRKGLVAKREDVDSKHIATTFAETSPDKIEDIIKSLDGAFCLTWYDRRTSRFNLIRNEARPMFYTVQNNKFYYASNSGFLKAAFEHEKVDLPFSAIQELAVGDWLQVDYQNFKVTTEIKKVELPKYNRVVYGSHASHSAYYQNYDYGDVYDDDVYSRSNVRSLPRSSTINSRSLPAVTSTGSSPAPKTAAEAFRERTKGMSKRQRRALRQKEKMEGRNSSVISSLEEDKILASTLDKARKSVIDGLYPFVVRKILSPSFTTVAYKYAVLEPLEEIEGLNEGDIENLAFIIPLYSKVNQDLFEQELEMCDEDEFIVITKVSSVIRTSSSSFSGLVPQKLTVYMNADFFSVMDDVTAVEELEELEEDEEGGGLSDLYLTGESANLSTPDEAQALLNKGCYYCGNKSTLLEIENMEVEWIDDQHYLCKYHAHQKEHLKPFLADESSKADLTDDELAALTI